MVQPNTWIPSPARCVWRQDQPGLPSQTLRAWLGRFAGRDDATFAVEGSHGLAVRVEELPRAGITAPLAEPARSRMTAS